MEKYKTGWSDPRLYIPGIVAIAKEYGFSPVRVNDIFLRFASNNEKAWVDLNNHTIEEKFADKQLTPWLIKAFESAQEHNGTT